MNRAMAMQKLMAGSAAVIICIVLFISCSSDKVSGIETTNGTGSVTAKASSIEGLAPSFSRIYISSADYLPLVDSGFARAMVTDRDGFFKMSGLGAGDYAIQIVSQDNLYAAHVDGVRVDPGRTAGERQFIMYLTGSVYGEAWDSADSAAILIYFFGTAHYELLSEPGPFSFPSLPAGTYTIRAALLHTGSQSIIPMVINNSNQKTITVTPGGRVNAGILRVE